MKSKAKIISFSLIILASIFLESVVFAENIKISRVENKLQTSGIDFEVEVLKNNSEIYPNKEVAYTVILDNKGVGAFVRFTLNANMLSDSYFYGLNKDLIKKGDYYYCTKPIKSKESVKLMDGFTVPKEITDTDTNITICGKYEAIQSQNFYPNFNSDNPWGDVLITEGTFDGSNYIAKATKVMPIEIDVARVANISSDEILSSEIISGDTIVSKIILKNNSNTDKEVLFESVANPNSRLFSEMKLTLKYENKIIYSGKLSKASFNKKIGTVKANGSKELGYEISMSTEADNLLSDKKDTLVWHMASRNIKNVKTGGNFSIDVLLIALFSSVIVGGIVHVIVGKNGK